MTTKTAVVSVTYYFADKPYLIFHSDITFNVKDAEGMENTLTLDFDTNYVSSFVSNMRIIAFLTDECNKCW